MQSGVTPSVGELHPNCAASNSTSATQPGNVLSVLQLAEATGFPRDQAQALVEFFGQLTAAEREEVLSVDKAKMLRETRQIVPCVGCCNRIETYISEIINEAKSASETSVDDEWYAEWLLLSDYIQVNGEGVIRASDEAIADGAMAAELFIHGCTVLTTLGEETSAPYDPTNAFLLDEMMQNPENLRKTGALHRCVLHSKKALPSALWRQAKDVMLDQMEEGSNLEALGGVTELEDTALLNSLTLYLKRRRFCGTCRKRVLAQYETLRTGRHDLLHGENWKDPASLVSKAKETAKAGKEGEEQAPPSGSSASSDGNPLGIVTSVDVFPWIRYNLQTQKVLIPLDVSCFENLLILADSDHASRESKGHCTTEPAARQEILTCIGLWLREKLMDIWRAGKSEEVVRVRTQHIISQCLHRRVNEWLAAQHGDLVDKIMQEELNESELKEEKLRRKREKRREKKKRQQAKQNSAEKAEDEENDDFPPPNLLKASPPSLPAPHPPLVPKSPQVLQGSTVAATPSPSQRVGGVGGKRRVSHFAKMIPESMEKALELVGTLARIGEGRLSSHGHASSHPASRRSGSPAVPPSGSTPPLSLHNALLGLGESLVQHRRKQGRAAKITEEMIRGEEAVLGRLERVQRRAMIGEIRGYFSDSSDGSLFELPPSPPSARLWRKQGRPGGGRGEDSEESIKRRKNLLFLSHFDEISKLKFAVFAFNRYRRRGMWWDEPCCVEEEEVEKTFHELREREEEEEREKRALKEGKE